MSDPVDPKLGMWGFRNSGIEADAFKNSRVRSATERASTLLFAADPSVNGILVESPDPPNPDGRDLALRGVLAYGNLVQF
jgi:hypothetical protein